MYFDAYIDVCPAYGWEGTPTFNTRLVTLANGRERRNANWSQPRMRYSANFQNILHEYYMRVLTMFMACKGREHCFKFRDELNYQATDQQFGVGDGTTDEFQLQTVFTVNGSIPYGRNVYAIRSISAVRVNGTPTTAYTVDLDRGVVTMDSPPANAAVLEWDGEFDIWVRFENDDLPFTIDSRSQANGILINGSVNLIEVPPPPVEVS
jgi:uncharacterized protein (TIGR02217 family)